MRVGMRGELREDERKGEREKGLVWCLGPGVSIGMYLYGARISRTSRHRRRQSVAAPPLAPAIMPPTPTFSFHSIPLPLSTPFHLLNLANLSRISTHKIACIPVTLCFKFATPPRYLPLTPWHPTMQSHFQDTI